MASSIFVNYDPSKVVYVFSGILFSGFVEETFLSAEKTSDSFVYIPGVNIGTRILSSNRAGLITATIQAGSPTNTALTNRHLLDLGTGQGHGPSLIKYLGGNGLTAVKSLNSWIMKAPNMDFAAGEDPGTRIWVIGCADIDIRHGDFTVVPNG